MKKNIIGFLALALAALSSCSPDYPDAGTLRNVDKGNNEKIEVYRYYFEEGDWVYIARFKDCPEVQTTTWTELHGKSRVTRGNVVVYENDSIQVILKGK